MSEQILKFSLLDAMVCIRKIMEYTKGMDCELFTESPQTYDAVLRNLEVLGEAINRIPNNFLNKYPEVPWNKTIGMRNRLIHGYDMLDNKIIWQTVTTDIPELKNKIEQILAIL